MPKASAADAQELAKLSSDCSFMLSHLIRQNAGRSDAEALGILKLILDVDGVSGTPMLKAASTGWYASAGANVYDPLTGKMDGSSQTDAVCFTESTLAGLRAHRDVFQVKYGLSFDRDWLFGQGANPCLNVRESLLKDGQMWHGSKFESHLFNFIPAPLHPFVNIVHEGFDATHEREWRYPGHLSFGVSDVRFVFCPEADFATLAAIQCDGMPALFDLAWLDRV